MDQDKSEQYRTARVVIADLMERIVESSYEHLMANRPMTDAITGDIQRDIRLFINDQMHSDRRPGRVQREMVPRAAEAVQNPEKQQQGSAGQNKQHKLKQRESKDVQKAQTSGGQDQLQKTGQQASEVQASAAEKQGMKGQMQQKPKQRASTVQKQQKSGGQEQKKSAGRQEQQKPKKQEPGRQEPDGQIDKRSGKTDNDSSAKATAVVVNDDMVEKEAFAEESNPQPPKDEDGFGMKCLQYSMDCCTSCTIM